jgi:mono/diheme cytochrome c family protein
MRDSFNVSMRAAGLVALLGAVLLVAGCGGGGSTSGNSSAPTSLASGKKLFEDSGCGNCHTLQAAGSTGTLGPNLDQLKPTRDQVVAQLRSGGGGMPSFSGKLSDAQIDAVAAFVSGAATSNTTPAAIVTFKPSKTQLSSCKTGDSTCYLQAFGNLSYHEGPAKALAVLRQKSATDPAIETTCHPIAHTIGAGALLRYHGNVAKAFGQGDPTCGSGYYHGLLQWKLAGVTPGKVASVARNVCSDPSIRANAYDYYQCVHGLGHGLMLYTRYDLPKALDLCHQLATSYDSISCSGGVFMENQQSSYGIRSKWLKKDDLLYPCDIVSRQDKLYCYLLVTSYILPQVGWDWKKTADWCRKSDADFVQYCFQSYGRDASGSAREDPTGIIHNCARAGSGEKECIFGAVRDILNNDPSDVRSKELCTKVKSEFRAYCTFGIGSIVGTYYSTAAEQHSACVKFSPAGELSQCLTGAGTATKPSK